jgi:hypothetical protein
MPTLMLRHSSSGRLRTLPLQPAVAWQPRARNLRGATSVPAAEGATRGCGSTTSDELHLAPAVRARAGWCAFRLARGGSRSRDIIESAWRESEPRHHRSKVALRPTVTLGTPSRPDDELRVSTTTATTARATTMTTTMTASAAGHRTSEVPGPLSRASET